MNLIRLIRYRFFLFAGILPYFLGQAIAFGLHKSLCWSYFWWGFAGIFSVLVAVELFNEYFDAKEGGGRIFSQKELHIPNYFYGLGILALALASIIGLYLTYKTGWPVLLFSFLGFLGAYFYVGPPLKWAYRGMGELVIALSYGPIMVLGSYYIQTERIGFVPFFVSLILGMCMFSLAVLNEIPDYYQDKLVGKRNLVVKLGKQKATMLLRLCLGSMFTLLALGVVLKRIPISAVVTFVMLPLVLKNLTAVEKNYENPKVFLSAINVVVVTYVVTTFSLGIGFLKG